MNNKIVCNNEKEVQKIKDMIGRGYQTLCLEEKHNLFNYQQFLYAYSDTSYKKEHIEKMTKAGYMLIDDDINILVYLNSISADLKYPGAIFAVKLGGDI